VDVVKMKDAQETQISAFVSKTLKMRLERVVRARGLKKGFVIERALEHHLQALQEIPGEFIIPPTLVVTSESFEKLLKQLKSPPKPTPALRNLMRGDSISEDGLH
jgi:uncharacterized protein (DUF1778 family)